MRGNPFIVFLGIMALLVNACGKIDMVKRHARNSTIMSETEAMSTLMEVPAPGTASVTSDAGSGSEDTDDVPTPATTTTAPSTAASKPASYQEASVTADNLIQIIQDQVASGNIRLANGTRLAAGTTADLSMLANIFSLLQSGQANNLLGLAQGLVNMNNGNTSGTASGLERVLQIINAVMPVISTIAPQFGPVLQALTVVIPLVMTFIGLFKKPKTKTTSLTLSWAPGVA